MGNLALWDGGQRNPKKIHQLFEAPAVSFHLDNRYIMLISFFKSLNLPWALMSLFLVSQLS